MAKLLNLHRAARLVGVTRGALQKKIQEGALDAYDGMITLDELHRAYPDVTLEDNAMLEQVAQIKALAFGHRIMDRALPDKEVLAARLHELSKELVETKSLLKHARGMLDSLGRQLDTQLTQGGADAAFAARLKAWLHTQHMQTPPASDLVRSLLIRDSFLRVMSAQVKVLPSGADFFVEGNDTVLEAGLRAAIPLAYGCAGGSCGKCKARVVSGEIKQVRSQEYTIPAEHQMQGYALMCCCTAVSDLVIEAEVAGAPSELPQQHIGGIVRAIECPTDEVAVIHIKTSPRERLRFLAGQRAVVTLGSSLASQLSIASCPCEDRHLEFHVRRLQGNLFSDYVFERLKPGDEVSIRGPLGHFVLNGNAHRPIVFLAFCNGFAAIKSLMEHAMALDQAESLCLLWIAAKESGLYLPGLARAWADALDNFSYVPILLGGDLEATASRQENAVERMLGPRLLAIPTLTRSDIYVAGPSLVVEASKKMLRALSVPEAQIFTDSE